jgi:hypothetical protein
MKIEQYKSPVQNNEWVKIMNSKVKERKL